MSLESTIKEIRSLKPFAEENTDVGPTNTMTARRGRKNQAIDRIKTLRRDYVQELIKSAVYIVTVGTQRNEFQELATSEKFGLFSADPETFYKDLANRVHPSLYQDGKASPSNLFDVLGRHLEDKMSELEVNEYNQIIFKEKYIASAKNAEEFAGIIKTAINEQMGSEIVGVQAAYSIANQAIDRGHSARITPIVLSTGDENLAIQLGADLKRLTSRVYLVLAGKVSKTLKGQEDTVTLKEVTEDSVKSTLDKIKNAIKQ